MSAMAWLFLCLYIFFGILGYLDERMVKINGVPARPVIRTLVGLAFLPAIGLVFFLVGTVLEAISTFITDIGSTLLIPVGEFLIYVFT